ncbi:MAG: hypothetical protein KI792_03495 [Alphaproteobacteria bacterium]|nr:hypothetical protein [Alphaproteobacteria bacterium SS10]
MTPEIDDVDRPIATDQADQLRAIETRLDALEARNQRVEADKNWETSLLRRVLIAGLTFAGAVTYLTYLTYLDVQPAWMHALIPTGAYLISSISLGLVRRLYIKRD